VDIFIFPIARDDVAIIVHRDNVINTGQRRPVGPNIHRTRAQLISI
jgi:hypothetical protein